MSDTVKKCSAKIRQRWILALMCFFGLMNAFAMRGCLSIAITEMAVPVTRTSNSTADTCEPMGPTAPANSSGGAAPEGRYNWSESTQGYIFSSFYWGYVLTQIPGGMIAQNFGGKYVLGFGVLLSAVFTILTPVTVHWGDAPALIVLRVLMGLCSGVTYPAINSLLAKWIPPEERSRAASFVYAGALIGSMFGTLVPGYIMQYSEMGWPLVFYVIGAISVLWFLVWQVTCYNSPQEHPFVSQQEIDYLTERMNEHTHTGSLSVPWRHVLVSKPLWALMIGLIGFSSSLLTLISYLPKYMSGVLKFSVEYNGYLTSMVYLCMWISGNVSSWVADYLISKKNMSTTLVRKGGSLVALSGSGVFLVAASYAGCDRVLAAVLFVLSLTTMGAAFPSVMLNSLDLSPNYAGTLTGMTNGLATTSGIIMPIIIGYLTPNQGLSEWNIVYWLVFGIAVVCNVVFLLFGSGDVAYWNDPNFNKIELSVKA